MNSYCYYHKTEMYCGAKHNWNYDNWLEHYQAEVSKPDYSQRSILKSTRQKNWLSIPGEKQRVTFQFEIPKITGSKLKVLLPARETT